MNQAEALYHLQQIDLAILKAQKRLDEIASLLTNSHAVIAAKQTADAAAQKLAPFRAKSRDLELEIQTNIQKAKSTDQQLYSGSIKNPKAMQEMQQELVALKKRQSELEDQLLEIMMQTDEAQTNLDTAKTALTDTTQTWEAGHASLLTEQTELKAQLDLLQTQRQAATKPITPENLKTYMTLKPRKSHQPMSQLIGDSCSVCGIEQTMNIVQQVQHGNILTACANCGRLLIYKY